MPAYRKNSLNVLRGIATAALSALVCTLTPAVSYANVGVVAAGNDPLGMYIVQLVGDPIAAIPVAEDEQLDIHGKAAKQRGRQLAAERTNTLKRVPGAQEVYSYSVTFNGFAAKMTDRQAEFLATQAGVRSVSVNEILPLHTVSTPSFMGLTGENGVWKQQFGDPKRAGEGMIIGVIDTGITYDSASFAPLPEPRPDAKLIAKKWRGQCVKGMTCNNKLLGGGWYLSGPTIPEEPRSPLDYDGHGTHTASIAAGNHGVMANLNGQEVGEISGVAPAARIAAYKACWRGSGDGCSAADSVAAIDKAVADGVDVINFSVGGSATSNADPVSISLFNAAKMGVFIAASSGNNGENGPSTSAHNAPWVTTVAAGSHSRTWESSLILGNGAKYVGAGLGAGVKDAPLISATAGARGGVDEKRSKLCHPDTLDPEKVKGKIVVCDQGVFERMKKSDIVAQAGGIAMVLTNPARGKTFADPHSIPTIHLDNIAGKAVRDYLASENPKAEITRAVATASVNAPEVARFSSKGPGKVSHGDLLKPDIMAPGVDILASISPGASKGKNFGLMSGTSMASPQIAGIAALIKAARYKIEHGEKGESSYAEKGKVTKLRWGPMAVKSAMMTTASVMDGENEIIQRGGVEADPFDFGSGQVKPLSALNPGLVYNSGPSDWERFICATEDASKYKCENVPHRDPSSLNYPSIAIGDMPGKQTITRRVTNVSGKNSVYQLEFEVPEGYSMEVTPKVLRIGPGEHADYKVEFSRTDAEFNMFSFGSLTWVEKELGYKVRSPIALRSTKVTVPNEISANTVEGKKKLVVDTGFAGNLNISMTGLSIGQVQVLNLKDPDKLPFNVREPKLSDHTGKVEITVPPGAKIMKIAAYAAEAGVGTDVDMFAYLKANGELFPVGKSAGPDSDEAIVLADPEPGTYEVYVDLFSHPRGDNAEIKIHTWVMTDETGNIKISTPKDQARPGGKVEYDISWWGLESRKHYLAYITYGDGTTFFKDIGTSFRIDT